MKRTTLLARIDRALRLALAVPFALVMGTAVLVATLRRGARGA